MCVSPMTPMPAGKSGSVMGRNWLLIQAEGELSRNGTLGRRKLTVIKPSRSSAARHPLLRQMMMQ